MASCLVLETQDGYTQRYISIMTMRVHVVVAMMTVCVQVGMAINTVCVQVVWL